MKAPIVIVGMGQLGSLFAEALLKQGHTVVPVLRGGNIEEVCTTEPAAIILAVGEDELESVWGAVPSRYRHRSVVLQNELRPSAWLSFPEFEKNDPTCAIVWFEKKPGTVAHIVLPTVLSGPHRRLLSCALSALGLSTKTIESRNELAHELVLKNLYILGLNLTGLRTGGTAAELLGKNHELFWKVIDEVLQLEIALLKQESSGGISAFANITLDQERLKADLKRALNADPTHGCSGRSAPARLRRTLSHAETLGLKLPTINSLQAELP